WTLPVRCSEPGPNHADAAPNQPPLLHLPGHPGKSNLGDASRNLIVPLLLLQLTHSPALLAALLLMQTVTGLVLRLPFGALLDRWDRGRAMLLSDLGRGGLTLLVPLAAALHGPVPLVLFCDRGSPQRPRHV